MSAPAAAERAVYKSADDEISAFDLIDSLRHGKLKLKNIKDEELPEEMRGLTLDEKREWLAQKEKEREEIKDRIMDLSKKRSAYISKKMKEMPRAILHPCSDLQKIIDCLIAAGVACRKTLQEQNTILLSKYGHH